MNTEQKVVIQIKNNTEKEIKNVSIFNTDSNGELEYSLPIVTDFLKFLRELEEPKNVLVLRYQYNCEDSNNDEAQLDSNFTMKYGESAKTFSFMQFFSVLQQQKDILDILGEYIDLKLQNDLDIILERIMPKTSVSISFFIGD